MLEMIVTAPVRLPTQVLLWLMVIAVQSDSILH